MINLKGIQSFCQECGACSASVECQDLQPDEDLIQLIAEQVLTTLGKQPSVDTGEAVSENGMPKIPLGVSNRHMHIRKDTFHQLFGPDVELSSYRDLYQPGEFAAEQVVTIVGPKMRSIQNVRILGPYRDYDQIELSLTDAIGLGIHPPIRNSGDLHDAAPLTIAGPKGSVFLQKCAIVANRHVHMAPRHAQKFGVQDGDYCKIHIGGDKPTTFEKVLVRVRAGWKLQMHLDTDDANAADVRCNVMADFIEKM